MGLLSRKTTILTLRSPALLVALMVVHGDCSNTSQTLFRIIRDAGWSSDTWPQIFTDFPECFGVVLCLAMLLASEDNLLRLYLIVLPVMSLIIINFVVTQHFLETTCFDDPPPPPPPPPTAFWSRLVNFLIGIVQYFVGKDDAAAAAVEDVSYDDYYKMLFIASVTTLQLALTSVLVNFVTSASSKVERITLSFFVNLFLVPCYLKFVGSSKSDVNLANTLVCRVVCYGMEIWSSLCLERMLYKSVRSMAQNGLLWMSVELWFRARRPLFVSWLVACSAQLVDSLLAADVSDLTYTEMMLSNLRHRSWTPMMYLGFCSAVGYLTEVVWKLVYLVVARSAPRQNVADNGMSEVLTLIHARLVCFFISISTADMFSFAIPFLTSLLTVRWIYRAVKELLLSDDRRTRITACAVYFATIVALPCFVCFCLIGENRVYLAGNLFIALRFSIKGMTAVIQSVVKRWYSAADVGDAEDINLVVRTVASTLCVCLGGCIVAYLIYVDAILVHVAISQPCSLLRPQFIGRCMCLILQTYLQGWLLVVQPFMRLVDSLHKHYGAAGRVLALPKLSLNDRRLEDPCAVCLTAMDAASTRLTPCGHAFHGKCLELSLRVSRDCPMCRHRLLGFATQ